MLTWKLSEIRDKVRAITGLTTTEDMSDDELNDRINDFYRNTFPTEISSPEFDTWFEQITAADDGGEYTVSQDYLRLETPMTTMDSDNDLADIKFHQDKDNFFWLYPEVASPTTGRPADALLYGGKLYLRPEPDAIYTFRAACVKKPDELDTDDAVPPDVRWGPCIAYGTSIEIKLEDGDQDAATELGSIYTFYKNKITQKQIVQKSQQRATPRH